MTTNTERLAQAQVLRDVLATLNKANESGQITDTIWHGPGETLWDFIENSIAALSQHAAEQAHCPHCDGTGDVHDATGEWRGTCNCEAATKQAEQQADKSADWRKLAHQFDAQRMAAMAHLRTLLLFPDTHAEAVRKFLAATPSEQAEQQAGPVGAECRFAGEAGWSRCSLEHHKLVQANPGDWPGYETRALYTHPDPSQERDKVDAERYRFLREQHPDGPVTAHWRGGSGRYVRMEELDQALDKMIEAKAAGKEQP